jgi:hypothetical protein
VAAEPADLLAQQGLGNPLVTDDGEKVMIKFPGQPGWEPAAKYFRTKAACEAEIVRYKDYYDTNSTLKRIERGMR